MKKKPPLYYRDGKPLLRYLICEDCGRRVYELEQYPSSKGVLSFGRCDHCDVHLVSCIGEREVVARMMEAMNRVHGDRQGTRSLVRGIEVSLGEKVH